MWKKLISRLLREQKGIGEMSEMDFDSWLKMGLENKWVGPPVCSTHDGLPSTEDEDMAWDDGDDPCIHILRLYVDDLEAMLVEQNHSPSVWRKAGYEE